MTLDYILGHMNYWFFVVLMMMGLYTVISYGNLVKKIVGLNIFQAAVFMLYISMGKITDGTAPIFPTDLQGKIQIDPSIVYSNPVPHVLILTAIVVGIATTSLGLALIVRIREQYDSIEEQDILDIDATTAHAENLAHGQAMGGRA